MRLVVERGALVGQEPKGLSPIISGREDDGTEMILKGQIVGGGRSDR